MILIYAGLAITTLVMLIGVVLMSFNKKLSDKFGNKFMNLRVISQAITIALIMILYYFKH
ncbi:MAG: HIG1 domain-containing protein [Rickettsiaceae bacterium]|nr:HIG1 domain-containing protein [Rickettsiaceae bacterium]